MYRVEYRRTNTPESDTEHKWQKLDTYVFNTWDDAQLWKWAHDHRQLQNHREYGNPAPIRMYHTT